MSHWRLPLRLATRDVRRRLGRTTLVALLIALPVAAMTMAVVVIRTDHSVTPLQVWEQSFGQADAVVYGAASGDDDTVAAPPVHIERPTGAREVSVARSYERVVTADGRRAGLDLQDLPLLDPISAGVHDLVEGRAPTGAGQIALGARLAGQLDVTVGDDLVLERPPATYHVVGLVEQNGCLSCPAALVAPGTLTPSAHPEVQVMTLLDLPDDMSEDELAAFAAAGEGMVTMRYGILPGTDGWFANGDDAGAEPVRWSLVLGAVALTVVGIVISAAFAVGARRQLVTLGQLSASGAPPRTVRAMLVLQGTVTGLIGAVGGLAIAGVALLAGRGLVEHVFDRRIDRYSVRSVDIALVVLIGVVAATVAALIPARTAAQVPTLAALAGRRPLAPVPRKQIALGTAAFAAGLALLALAAVGARSGQSGQVWAYVAILGGVTELLGACAVAPVVVARLEPLAARLRGPWRLGARTLARHRSRTGAVVSAVAAAGALAIAAGALILGAEARNGIEVDLPDDTVVVRQVRLSEGQDYESSAPADEAVRRQVEVIVPGAAMAVLRATTSAPATSDNPLASWLVQQGPGVFAGYDAALVADEAALDALRASSSLRRAIDDVGIVVLSDGRKGPVQVTLPDGRTVEGVEVPGPYVFGYFSQILVSPERAGDLGVAAEPFASVFRSDRPLDADQRDALDDLQYDLNPPATSGYVEVRWHRPHTGPSPLQVELLLTGLALVFSLFVVTVNLALAAAESRDERDILTVAGAPPATLARSAGARAWLLAAIGGVMAIPVGFLPVVVFAWAQSDGVDSLPFPVVFPTRTALVLLVGLPVAAALGAWAASAVAQRLRPVRISTAVFD